MTNYYNAISRLELQGFKFERSKDSNCMQYKKEDGADIIYALVYTSGRVQYHTKNL